MYVILCMYAIVYRLEMPMEKTLSITSARTQLLKLSKQVFRHMDRYVLTNKGVAEAVLLSVGEYQSLRAAAELAAHPEVFASTLQGFEEISSGRGVKLKTAFRDERESKQLATAAGR